MIVVKVVRTLRVLKHPILSFENAEPVSFYFEGNLVYGKDGDTILSALHALGIKDLSVSVKHKRPRGLYCAIGNCASCNMIVNDLPNVRTCITPLKPGMHVKRQTNKGELK